MSKPTTDHEHYCAITQAFFDDIDGDGPGAVEIDAPAELGDEDDAPISPGAAPTGDTTDVGDSIYGGADHLGEHRPIDDAPIDLDGPGPSGEQPSTQGAETSTPSAHRGSAENPPPGTDLVDQLTSTTGTDDAAGSAGNPSAPPATTRTSPSGSRPPPWWPPCSSAVPCWPCAATRTPASNPNPRHPNTRLSVLAAPSSTTPAPDNQDSTIPYTATSVGCLPGSTAAQSVAGPDSTQAWVCVTGGNVGQYLVLNLGRSMVITAVSITPGWVGADASGADQWHQHRVLTRVQWSFNDTPPTVVPQETASVHGEATKPMPTRGVLASRIIMLVQETGRAPADITPTTTAAPGGGGGLIGEVLGPPAAPADPAPTSSTPALPGLPADPSHTDPADNTFAVSSIKIFGHPPQ